MTREVKFPKIFDRITDKINKFLKIYGININPLFADNDDSDDNNVDYSDTFSNGIIDTMNKIFTIPGMSISLPNIAYLFTVNNFQQLINESAAYFDSNLQHVQKFLKDYHSNMPKSFKQCYRKVHEELKNEIKKNEFEETGKYMKMSPCNEINENHVCVEYCKWHYQMTNEFLNKTKKRF